MLGNDEQHQTLVSVFHKGTKLTYKKGEYIIRPGEAPSGIFFIETGLVKAYDITKYGEENMLIIRKENEIFPLIWAITGQERKIIYQALGPTVLWRIDQQTYLDHLRSNADVIAPLLDMVVEMYRIHSERIINLEYRSVRERLVSFLITMSKRFGKKTTRGVIIDVPLKHQDIASSINASRETTNREMIQLERKNLIKNRQGKITLLDLKGLKKIL